MRFCLPFPPSSLSGHTKGHWRKNYRLVATMRAEAFHLARAAKLAAHYAVPEAGDIGIVFTFYPPNNRGDRLNFPNRIKCQVDGIAEALGVNDKRFLPAYAFGEPCKPGRVEVDILSPESPLFGVLALVNDSGTCYEKTAPKSGGNAPEGLTPNLVAEGHEAMIPDTATNAPAQDICGGAL